MILFLRPTYATVLAAFALTALSGCGKPKEAEAEANSASVSSTSNPNLVKLGANAPELSLMKIAAVATRDIPSDEVTAPAKIEANPNRVGHAVLPAPGRIVRVMVKLGDNVTQGQPLVRVESSVVAEAETAYIQSDASVRQAELALTKSEADAFRLNDLFEHQAVAQKEVLAAKTTLALAQASLEQVRSGRDQSRRRLELLGLKPGQFQQLVTITAPVSGKVLELGVVEGEYRNEINTPLVTIADLSRVWATSEVPESKIRFCKVGGSVDLELIAYPDQTFRGRVTRIADTVDSDTRTIRVSAELENRDGRLRPEMFGRLRYADGFAPEVWVPDAAVVRISGKDYVFVELEPGHFRSTPVELGKHLDDGFSVLNGLSAGERIVTQGSLYLKAGR